MSDLLHIAFDPSGAWAYSRFPHPLVTADYDGDNRLIGLSFAGRPAHQLDETIREWVAENAMVGRLDGLARLRRQR